MSFFDDVGDAFMNYTPVGWVAGKVAGMGTPDAAGPMPQSQKYDPQQAPSWALNQLGPASQGTATLGQASQLDGSMQDQARGYQSGLLGQLQQQASGVGPSVAGQMLQGQTEQNFRQQAAMAAGNRGNPLAQYQAAQNAGNMNQQAAGQGAMARLNEQRGAQGMLGQVAGQMRDQDLGFAGQNAQLAQQMGLANMGAQNQYGLANMEARNQYGLAGAQMNQGANQFYNQIGAGQQNAYNSFLYQQALNKQQADLGLRDKLVGGAMQGAGSIGQMLGAA